ncbi:MAG TPA: pyruvate kinase [Spirochaetota bacterium]|nr:pyruvate kinase [Spirochaetota bacterium]HNT11990.1 pyruvate kinase [Spirochaetota bacterium]
MAALTEILATIGPASVGIIDALYASGLSGVRINSSHGKPADHEAVVRNSRRANPAGYIVYDIKGPKIRIGDIPEPLKITAGETLVIDTAFPKPPGSEYPAVKDFSAGIPVTYERLHECVKPGHRLFIDDGYIGLRVESVEGTRIVCTVMYGDLLRQRKGLNHPDTIVGYPYTMPYDIPNLEEAARMQVDFIADSFTRNADDVLELRDRLNGTGMRIISKIENPEGVENFDAILEKTDAIMVARGDLGVELDPWLIPELQKQMIEKCNAAGKPVITATQMLESMIDNPHPSRADVSDIANAIYDGTDVVMLSGETSVGKHPAECVAMMHRIAETVEATDRYREKKIRRHTLAGLSGSKS